MSLISGIIRKPVSVFIFVLLISVFSLFTAFRLNVDLLPNVEFPTVMVVTEYFGASPEEMEENITKPLESSIRGIANLESVSSSSNLGISYITVQFKYGSGLDQNVSNLKERIDRVGGNLPSDASSPVIFRFSSSDVPVVQIAISSNRNINETRDYVDRSLLSYFEQIDGVANVQLFGGSSESVYVETSINRLNAYDLTLSEIRNAIASNGLRSSIGSINTDVSDVALVLENKFSNLEDLKNLVVGERTNALGDKYFIRLRDIADVALRYDSENDISLFNGRPAVELQVYKLSDSNIIDVAENTRKTIEKVRSIAPKDFEFVVFDDNSTFIKDSLSAVSQAALSGGALAILVLLLFLRNLSSVLVIAISMPVSILLTLMFMYFSGIALNFMSIAGLALGIGMLVDNSIVVLEHIYNKRLRGVKLLPASEYGASEMSRPILASTLTTVLVFAPLLLFKNEIGTLGSFFAQLAFAVVVSVLASYCVAAFFVPILTSKYIPLYRARYKGILDRLNTRTEKSFIKLNHRYQNTLSRMLNKPWRFILFIVLLAILPLLLFPKLGTNFIPSFAPESLSVDFNFPKTMDVNEMYSYVNEFADLTKEIIPKYGAKIGNTKISVRENVSGNQFMGDNSNATYTVYFGEEINNDIFDKIVTEYGYYKNVFPGVNIFGIGARGGGPRSTSASDGVSLELKSNDYQKLLERTATIKSQLKDNFQDKLSNVSDNQTRSSLEYEIKVDRALANTYGVSVSSIENELKTAVRGSTANKFQEGSKEYGVILRLNDEDRKNSDLPERLYINSARGARLPIANLIDKNYSLGTNSIRRSEFQRTITISADTLGDYSTSDAVSDIKTIIASLPPDDEIAYFFSGEFEEMNESYRVLAIVFLLAVLFIYGIMASQFESFLDPFIIVFTVPLTFAGVVLIYFLTGNPFSSFTIVGIVMLVGIAVNHGIVLVDYINLLRKRGLDLKRAIVEGGESRLQPILMTTATTVLGLFPITLMQINGAALIKPLALTVVGGLSVSAFLSLFFIPLIYYQFHKRAIKVSDKKRRRNEERERYNVEGSKAFDEAYSLRSEVISTQLQSKPKKKKNDSINETQETGTPNKFVQDSVAGQKTEQQTDKQKELGLPQASVLEHNSQKVQEEIELSNSEEQANTPTNAENGTFINEDINSDYPQESSDLKSTQEDDNDTN